MRIQMVALLSAILWATNFSSSGAATTAQAVREAQSEIAKYSVEPKFVPPNPSFNVSSLKGKTIAIVAFNRTTTGLNQLMDAAQAASAAAGLQTTLFDAENNPSTMNQGIRQAIGQRAGAILLVGIPPQYVASSLESARAADIPVVAATAFSPDPSAPGQGGGPNIYAAAAQDSLLQGRLLADAAIVRWAGNVRAIFVNTPGLTQAPVVLAGYRAVFERCGTCSILTTSDIQIQDWATGLGPLTASLMRRYPDANTILPIFGSMSQFMAPAIRASGRTGEVITASTAGNTDTQKVLASFPTINIAAAGHEPAWGGWLAVNQAMRGMLKLPPGNPYIPTRYFTYDTVTKLGGVGTPKMFGTNYVEGFKKLWGIN